MNDFINTPICNKQIKSPNPCVKPRIKNSSKKIGDKFKEDEICVANVKRSTRSNAKKNISTKTVSKSNVLPKEEFKVNSENSKEKGNKNMQNSNKKLKHNSLKKSEISKNVDLKSTKKFLKKDLTFQNSSNKDASNIKERKKISQKSIFNYSEDEISFDDIEKKIFEDLSNKSKKNSSTNKNPSKSSSDCFPDKKVLDKYKTKQNSTSSSSKKPNMNTSLKQSEKESKTKSEKVEYSKRRTSNKGKKASEKKSETKVKPLKKKKIDKINESSSDEDDWEDVDELSQILQNNENNESNAVKDVQIELKAENILWGIKKRKHRTHQEQMEDYLRKEINRNVREVHENMHKTHLLCLLAHGMNINSLLCSETLTSCALSIIPQQYYSPKRLDLTHLEKMVNWFHSHFKIKKKNQDEKQESSNSALSMEEILIMRFETKSPASIKELVLMFVATCRTIGMAVRYVYNLTPMTWKPSSSALLKPKKFEDETDEKPISDKTENIQNKTEKNKKKSRKMLSSDSETEMKPKTTKPKGKKQVLSSSEEEEEYNSDEDDDEDFKSPFKFKNKRASTSKGKIEAKRRKSVEVQEENSKHKKEIFQDWAEIYVEEEEKWIPVDVSKNKIHCANEIETRAPNLAYVVAFNPDRTVKDVTKRYMSSWLSYKNKVRCDDDWWLESLKPFQKKLDRKEKAEDKELEENLKMQPLPKTISEYKNHPLYALQRHLLKFEAIYPPDASPVGFIRSEPVFPRECVKNLNGRENWIKEAKTVIVDEEPYKIVKARPKWDRNTCQMIKDRPLELFGEWQVEDYDPPTAKNGRVPRNEYGNVDLFKPCMLPKGCVHIRINGLSRVARKLRVDCVPAVTGFDYHSGACHTTTDGFIVCKEHEDILLDAWHQDQIEQVKKEEEKRMKRIYDNWKRLIYGITLKVRLKERYGVTHEEFDESCSKVKETKRKIRQEDLNALPSSTITHSVVNLKIDFGASVTEGMKKGKKPKRTTGASAARGTKPKSKKIPEKSFDNLSSHSSDSEEMSDGEKKKKIRSILDWNPTIKKGDSDPYLSDDSSDENETINAHLKNSSIVLTPISEGSSVIKKTIKTSLKASFTESSKVKRKLNSKDRLSSGSESEDDVKVSLETNRKRRSLRTKIVKKANYNDDSDSQSDISVEDSDTGDLTYCPMVE